MKPSPPRLDPAPSPRHSRPAAAFTVLELVVALALAGVLVGMSLPAGRGLLDRLAVGAERDRALAALHRVRVEARIRDGATLAVDGRTGVLTARAGDSLLWRRADAGRSGVRITHPDGTPAVDTLDFDAWGLGVVTSRTLVFRRGHAEARLVISSRGRGSRR
jgi:type II secretory pathway pseudopilin PulG